MPLTSPFPLWATFMKAATRERRARMVQGADGSVTTATVCRISGKLASEGCEHVEVVDTNGEVETRSMVYTEYFARGTEPTEYCELHSRAWNLRDGRRPFFRETATASDRRKPARRRGDWHVSGHGRHVRPPPRRYLMQRGRGEIAPSAARDDPRRSEDSGRASSGRGKNDKKN